MFRGLDLLFTWWFLNDRENFSTSKYNVDIFWLQKVKVESKDLRILGLKN